MIFPLIKKELYQIIRDPSVFLLALFLPLMLLFLYGNAMSLDIKPLKIGIAMEDSSPQALAFTLAISHSPYFDVKVSRQRENLTQDLLSGNIRGIVIIPSYFTAFFKNLSQKAPIQVIADGSEPNTANFVHNYVNGAWMNALKSLRPPPAAVTIEPRFWFNEELKSRNFILPGSLAIIMALVGTLLTALVIAREWEKGTMEALMATSVTSFQLMIGKLIPYFILGMASMTMCIFCIEKIYGVPLRGSWFAIELTGATFLFTALTSGLLISTLTKNQFAAAQASMTVAFLPAYMLSGFIFEISSMPITIQWITYLLPARYFVSSLQTLFLVGDVFDLLLKNIAIMLFMGVTLFFIAIKITPKRL